MHRDLKPDNIGVSYITPINFSKIQVKLLDFGFAKAAENHSELNQLTDFIGTPYFIAPEIIKGEKYGPKCDIWSLGVITYSLMCGKYPFEATDRKVLYDKIRKGDVQFEDGLWSCISDDCKNFIE